MDKNSTKAGFLSKIIIIIGSLCALLGGILVLVFAVMDIDVPKYLMVVFCIGCFISAGVNICSFTKAMKNRQNN